MTWPTNPVTDPQAGRQGVAEPRSGFVWLASYPKSGNTWTRAFLHNLIKTTFDEDDIQDINGLNRFTVSVGGRDLYAEMLGFKPTDRHREQTAAVRHRVQRYVAEQFEGLIFAKTHQALMVDRGSTTIDFEVTAGAIYIVRNPLDVVISLAHHLGQSVDRAIAIMGTRNIELDVTETQVHEVIGSWSQHVLTWTRRPHRAIYIMRYEDMLAAPEATFDALARHLLMSPTAAQLADAIDRSSFDKLRAQEDVDGFRERPRHAGRFFREGRAGQWKDILTAQQIDRIVRDHGEQMTRFGYLPV
jgi:hypothetical protein